MFGLGVGSLVGGKLSQRWPNHLPQLFLLCELAIGAFGLVSLPLIKMPNRDGFVSDPRPDVPPRRSK